MAGNDGRKVEGFLPRRFLLCPTNQAILENVKAMVQSSHDLIAIVFPIRNSKMAP
jgi:hypothetical protein